MPRSIERLTAIKKISMIKMKTLVLFAMITAAFSSCVAHQDLITFRDASFTNEETETIENATQLRIQPDDLIRISVHSVDEEAAAPFNIDAPMTQFQAINGGSLELFSGYLVDREGFIDFPLLGKVEVEGLTLEDVKANISDSLETYIKAPVVNARYLNFKVVVLGEVNNPGMVRLTNSRVTILEAIGQAGDLGLYADRQDIVVVREMGGKRSYARVNLYDDSIFDSPFFYLQQNDVVYVKPLRAKTAAVADPAQRVVSYGTAAISLVALVLTLLLR